MVMLRSSSAAHPGAARWDEAHNDDFPDGRASLRVCFPFLAQAHQTPHALPIAMELAAAYPDIEVTIAYLTDAHLDLIRQYAAFYPNSSVRYRRLHLPALARADLGLRGLQLFRRLAVLPFNTAFFDGFDAIVTPELTSLLLKRLGVRRPKFIWTLHGAGDRAAGFKKSMAGFDFVLMAGEKLERRFLELGLLRPGAYATGVYAKFDLVPMLRARQDRFFDNRRPTVLYNPHFDPALSSWPKVGFAVLDWFAANPAYNLIFAPHVRLFDPPTPGRYRRFKRYAGLPNMKIDLGSSASIDMTYTMAADVYLGDVSSQIAEFLTQPRPCVFLNPRHKAWETNENFRAWSLGEVATGVRDLATVLPRAIRRHPAMVEMQEAYVRETFGVPFEPSAKRGAAAIAGYLKTAG